PVQPLLGQWAPAHAGAGSRAAPLRSWCVDSSVLRGVATLVLCACASSAAAQLSGTLTGVSDYRYRGNTLTDRMPAAQAGVTYDDPKGWYAGAFGSTVRLKPPGGPSSYFQAIAYAGYAKRLASGISVEAGGDYSAFAGSDELSYG